MVVAKYELTVPDPDDAIIAWETADDGVGDVENHTSPLVITLPTNRNVDDIVLIAIAGGTGFGGPSSPPAGWTEIGDSGSALQVEHYVMWRRMDGTEADTVNVTLTSNGLDWSWRSMRISGAHTTSAPEKGTTTWSDTTSCDPASVSPSWGGSSTSLFIALLGMSEQSAVISTYPTGYTNQVFSDSNESSGLGVCSRKAVATTEDPSAFVMDVDPGNAAYGASVVAFRDVAN